MTKVESILRQAESLTEGEFNELLAALLERSSTPDADDLLTGARGLHNLTESTRDDDWSAFYPPDLHDGGGTS